MIKMAATEYITQALWSAVAEPKAYAPLSGDIEVDVAVVGAGITGLSTACLLAKAGKKVAVLEEKQVGMGTTGSSTGNLYAPVDERLYSISSKHNMETMKSVAVSRIEAIDLIEQLVKEYNIDCDFERVPWYFFSEPGDDMMKKVEKEREAAREAGLYVSDKAPGNFPFKVGAIANVAKQAQFNPLKYVQGLADAIFGYYCQIYENTKVTRVEDGETCIVHTNYGKVRAKKVVMATHSPKGIYGVHTAMEPYREYAMAVKLRGELPAGGVYWHMRQMQHYSVRPYSNGQGNFLLVLGEAHKVGSKEHNEENFPKLEQYLRERFDVKSVVYKWAAQNYKPADTLPYIGTSPMENNTYIATGFAADGLTYGTLAAMIISDAIQGKENPWASLYDPKRFTPVASAPKFIKENVSVATHLVKDYLLTGDTAELKEVKLGEGKVIKMDGDQLAVYNDEQGQIHVVSAVCTHMGCVVHWNNAEKSWDCPCHGSRFSTDGDVLEGPAYDSLSKINVSRDKQG
jgi:glycine/D-amino acid oxidase-like deaminating enzyme/nitrite reductase/ring-hydroxylating ferredoxin subunit